MNDWLDVDEDAVINNTAGDSDDVQEG